MFRFNHIFQEIQSQSKLQDVEQVADGIVENVVSQICARKESVATLSDIAFATLVFSEFQTVTTFPFDTNIDLGKR